jgi:hypothetical protein
MQRPKRRPTIKMKMSEPQNNVEDQKTKIIAQTAALSRLIGMIPSDGYH